MAIAFAIALTIAVLSGFMTLAMMLLTSRGEDGVVGVGCASLVVFLLSGASSLGILGYSLIVFLTK